VQLFLLSVKLQPKTGLGRLAIFEVSKSHTIRHTHTHTHTVGFHCTSDQPDAEAATYATLNTHKRRTSMPSARFEPAIPAMELPQTYG